MLIKAKDAHQGKTKWQLPSTLAQLENPFANSELNSLQNNYYWKSKSNRKDFSFYPTPKKYSARELVNLHRQ
jgi:hypothetical protein